jgi:uncharacterized protein
MGMSIHRESHATLSTNSASKSDQLRQPSAPPIIQAPLELQNSASVQPSFDCTKAVDADEKIICVIPHLENLDLLTTQAFNQARAIQNNHDAAPRVARKFIAARRVCNGLADCIAVRSSRL